MSEVALKEAKILRAIKKFEAGLSLSTAAETAGLSISEMMDVLAEHGVKSDLRLDDYRESLQTLRGIW